ncbi:MAG: 7-carboxy-7-deazaguanine synthase QueE [Rhodocyclaceae bacterium]|nr:7-carboxy-7-deazaguanine synthase QueE [Rhodocyclaceae bacterium]
MTHLRVSEIFHSLQGESTRVGLPTVFVRLTGCPLRCTWCDSAFAFTGGEMLNIDEILRQVAYFDCPVVCVTGGEPLAQKECLTLLTLLCNAGYSVSLETSGALDVSAVDARVSRIVDIKAPDSGEVDKNRWENLDTLTAQDELKIVLASESDYEWAKALLMERHLIGHGTKVLFAAVEGFLASTRLADWIVRDRLPVRLQIQLHKVLWGNMRRR